MAAAQNVGSELTSLRMDTECGEKDAAIFFSALDEFSLHEFANFIFGDVGHGGDDLKVTEARIDLDCCHGTVSLVHTRQASYIPMG